MAPRPKPPSARAGATAQRKPSGKGSAADATETRKASMVKIGTKAAPASAKADAAKAGSSEPTSSKAKSSNAKSRQPTKTSGPRSTSGAKASKAPAAAPKTAAQAKSPAKAVSARGTEDKGVSRPGKRIAKTIGSKTQGRAAKIVAAANSASKRKPASVKAAAPSAKAKRAKKADAPAFLAVELGTPVDPQGEPIGAGSPRAQSDRELQEYALQLWRQMQRGSVTKRYMRSMERAGITLDEVWTVGLREVWTTSSTADEMRRYRQRMLFRANLLEAIMSETIADLHRLEGIEPIDAAASDAAATDADTPQPPSEPSPPAARRSQAAQRT